VLLGQCMINCFRRMIDVLVWRFLGWCAHSDGRGKGSLKPGISLCLMCTGLSSSVDIHFFLRIGQLGMVIAMSSKSIISVSETNM